MAVPGAYRVITNIFISISHYGIGYRYSRKLIDKLSIDTSIKVLILLFLKTFKQIFCVGVQRVL